MKTSQYSRPFLILFAVLAIAASSCNDEKTGEPGEVIASNDNLSETDLPKGKYVIDDNTGNVNPNDGGTIAPVSGPGSEDGDNSDPGTPGISRRDQLRKVYKQLLVFHADDTMEVNRTKLATLILARDASIEKLKVEVLSESNAEDDNIKADSTIDLGSKMKAKLVPLNSSKLDNSFEIEALGGDEQSFRKERRKLIWQWKITPLKEGLHELKLSIQIIEKDGEAVYLPARNIPVVIFAKKVSFASRVGNFFATKYEWIITVILLPIFIAWLTARVRHRTPRGVPPSPPQ